MKGSLVKDLIPAIKCDQGDKKPIMVLNKQMFTSELLRNLEIYRMRLNDSINQLDYDEMTKDIANIQLCLKHLCDAMDILPETVKHVYELMHNQEGGYDARLYQMDAIPAIPVANLPAEKKSN